MIKLRNNRTMLAPIFSEMEHTLILSYLQGYLGEGWVDSLDAPTCGQIRLKDFSFVAGDWQAESAMALIKNLPTHSKNPWFLLIPQNEAWGKLVEACYPYSAYKLTRYATKKTTKFSNGKLQANVSKLNSAYRLARIDENLYTRCLKHPQLKDLCTGFLSAKEYLEQGVGFCVTHDEKVVCEASAYSVYNAGIEIEVDTDETYRRQGLATVCASQLMLACQKTGKHPGWDAATPKSLALAEKLGYEFSHAYVAYAIKMA